MSAISINSSAIRQIEYHRKSKDLDIWFTDGIFQVYLNVPPDVYRNLLHAQSAGAYFNANIRGNYAFK